MKRPATLRSAPPRFRYAGRFFLNGDWNKPAAFILRASQFLRSKSQVTERALKARGYPLLYEREDWRGGIGRSPGRGFRSCLSLRRLQFRCLGTPATLSKRLFPLPLVPASTRTERTRTCQSFKQTPNELKLWKPWSSSSRCYSSPHMR